MEPIDTEQMQRLREWFNRFREMRNVREHLMNESRLVVCQNLLWTEPSHYIISTLRSEDHDEA